MKLPLTNWCWKPSMHQRHSSSGRGKLCRVRRWNQKCWRNCAQFNWAAYNIKLYIIKRNVGKSAFFFVFRRFFQEAKWQKSGLNSWKNGYADIFLTKFGGFIWLLQNKLTKKHLKIRLKYNKWIKIYIFHSKNGPVALNFKVFWSTISMYIYTAIGASICKKRMGGIWQI